MIRPLLRLTSLAPLLLLALLLATPGCSKAYYGFWDRLGWDKPDLLVASVKDARESQQEAKEEFKTALEQFQSAMNYEPGEVDEVYERLNDAYEDSAAQAEEVRERIAAIREHGEALFDDWEEDLDEFSDAEYRRTSERMLNDSRQDLGRLVSKMERAAESMDPVLSAMKDQQLLLKGYTYRRAITQLEERVPQLEADVQRLIQQMNESIEEANRFIEQMGGEA